MKDALGTDCTRTVDALIAALESGATMEAEQRRHLSQCEECGRVLRSARTLQAELDEADAPGAHAAGPGTGVVESEVAAASRRRERWRIAGAGALGLVIFGALFLLVRAFVPDSSWEMTVVTGIVLVSIGVPLGAVLIARKLVRKSPGNSVSKRLKPGRQLSGVCLGIAERLGISVGIVRLIFVLLFLFFQGSGFWLYVALAIILPVHPDDREYLLRFRLRRLVQRWQGSRA